MEELIEVEEKRGPLKLLLVLMLISVMIGLLFVYWFVPLNSVSFGSFSGNSNFSLDSNSQMQFYENMRFPETRISYHINDCPLQKEDDMQWAFEILENKTILDFYPVVSEPEISVTCDSRNKLDGSLFIAGEGGPTNITKTQNFNVILSGSILLLRDSSCEIPNVAIHELLHVLGFDHSSNNENIMYNLSNCRQTIGDDIIDLINELYSFESLPDLTLENVSAIMNRRYLDTNISVKNYGLQNSRDFKINIYADDKLVKTLDIEELDVGYGTDIALRNLFVNKLNTKNLRFEIDYSHPELDKTGNTVVLIQ